MKRWVKKTLKNSVQRFMSAIEAGTNFFISINLRPQYAKDYGLFPCINNKLPKTGIIIQGPILKKVDFTLETAKIYQQIFPNNPIIISTWEDEDPIYLERFKGLKNIYIVLNRKPSNSGSCNLNYQIISTLGGIGMAKQLNCEYVLKTRSDQRAYNPNTHSLLFHLINQFPIMKGETNIKQSSRIIVIGKSTVKYIPYHLCDMFMFGEINDVYCYWNVCLDTQRNVIIDARTDFSKCNLLFNYNCAAETYLLTNYLKKYHIQVNPSISESRVVYARYFIIIDAAMIDLYWCKYLRRYLGERLINGYKYQFFGDCMTFSDWLNDFYALPKINYISEFEKAHPDFLTKNARDILKCE